jgi:DNA-binding transcriptional ArsR family regulator
MMSDDSQSTDAFSRIAHALADPRRYAILKQIATQGSPISFAALRQEHAIGAPTMSHHLKLLAGANLIEMKRQGQRTAVVLRPEVVEQYLRELQRQLKIA